MRIIKLDRSIIPACDVENLEQLNKLVEATCDVDGIGGYKIGFQLVIPFGMEAVIETIRDLTDLPIIYDHQKAATDIPELGKNFANACKGVNAVILFPLAGPETENAWIKAVQDENTGLIVGGEMTHHAYLEADGGFILNNAPDRIYLIAADAGVTDFVVPGNKPGKIQHYREFLEAKGIKPVLYSPGLVAQGGSITDSGKAAGDNWHAIVGRAIYEARSMRKAVKKLTKKIN